MNSQPYQGFPENFNLSIQRSLSFTPQSDCSKLILIMVGLPARGKSYISRKICNFLCWRGHRAKVFNVGQLRRENMISEPKQKASFFCSEDKKNVNKRHSLAIIQLHNAFEWLRTNNGQIAIFDATNTTRERRSLLVKEIKNANYRFLFIESICDREEVINENLKVKAERSPDFQSMKIEDALKSLKERLKFYTDVYEPLSDDEGYGYIKMFDMGCKLICHKLHGYISRLLMVFLLNLNVDKNVVLLVRAGNSIDDLPDDKVQFKEKESNLSEEGITFAKKLAQYVKKLKLKNLQILSSPLPRAIQTAQFMKIDSFKTEEDFQNDPDAIEDQISICTTPNLKMVHQGICYGMKRSAIKKKYPDYYSQWKKKPLTYRFPEGESYMEAVERMESIVIDLEQISSPVQIITHHSNIRILYAYFKSLPIEEVINLNIPQGMVLIFTPTLYGWVEERVDLMAEERAESIVENAIHNIERIPVESPVVID